jgi:hypothetical protein
MSLNHCVKNTVVVYKNFFYTNNCCFCSMLCCSSGCVKIKEEEEHYLTLSCPLAAKYDLSDFDVSYVNIL